MNVDTMLHRLTCVIFDFETTGLHPNERIVEIAAVRLEDWQPVSEFNTLINPQKPIPPASRNVHLIDDEMVQYAPTFNEIAPHFAHFIEDAVLVGHNIFKFDLKFLNSHMMEAFGSTPNNWAIDTLPLSRALLNKPRNNLRSLAEHFSIPILAHHAMSDVYATSELWLYLSVILKEKGIHHLGELEHFKALQKLEGKGLPKISHFDDSFLCPRPLII